MKKRRVLIFLAVLIPLAMFVAARNAASWRPQLVHQSASKSETFLISSAARWMVCNDGTSGQEMLIDLSKNRLTKLRIEGQFLKFTQDETAAFFQSTSGSQYVVSLRELPSGKLRRNFPLPGEPFLLTDVQFSNDGKRLVGVTDAAIINWDANTGRVIKRRSRKIEAPPFMFCGVRPEAPAFSFLVLPREKVLSQGGSLLRKTGKIFAIATGKAVSEPVTAPEQFTVNRASNYVRVSDRQTDVILFNQPSIGSNFTPDQRWLLNAKSEGILQLIDTRNWQIVAQRDWISGEAWATVSNPDFVVSADRQGRVWRWRLR